MNNYLGIDIGSVAIGIAVINDNTNLLQSSYVFHKGQIAESLLGALKEVDISKINAIGYTSSGVSIVKYGRAVDSRIAYITAAKYFHPQMESLLIIGAEKFGLATFDKDGQYQNYKSNSSCAAGTGNFLDQQAERLNIQNIQEFSRIAWENEGEIPKIASRCAVFAKTDLIHAQQEGYSIGEICDGLSYGLAKNIVDTVFQNNMFHNIVAAGGVALNKAVITHIGKLLKEPILVDAYAHLYGAIGAAMHCRTEGEAIDVELYSPSDLIISKKEEKKYYYPPLKLMLSDYPDFNAHEKYIFNSDHFPLMKDVEVDAYLPVIPQSQVEVFLGIDIGSTSTKAVLIDHSKEVIAGFYTYTLGQPLQAVQLIFEAISEYSKKRHVTFLFSAAGTTGSGRKFTGQIIGADLILDEITAHARAAFELNPQTDTIIEIGGQDSKFTVMQNGMVTFSVMNNVCAAGTGSFIEEQAKRLNCTLDDYSARVEHVKSPMASDRCTVFMERDLNHYLMAGYSTDEILATVLHSTRENYFTKVAIPGYIGKTIFFQGATAKNRALVAAFEQKLNKPILVSRYCHLTGALGVALELHDQNFTNSQFRGVELYTKSIPIRSEICDICTNHCKLKVAEIDNNLEAYGFLCGRDYEGKKYATNKAIHFQLIKKREELFKFKATANKSDVSIGIPAGLYLFEELFFWQKFFDLLSIKTVTSQGYLNAIKDGKNLAGAEFCSPIAAMHGHVDYLRDKADYIFLPIYFEESRDTKSKKQYCYYSQFITSVISTQKNFNPDKTLLTPVVNYSNGELSVQMEILHMLKAIKIQNIGLITVRMAYEKARNEARLIKEKWRGLYTEEVKRGDDIHIMLLGRPYTMLSSSMNNSIPEIIEKMGIKTFYMDMLPSKPFETSKTEELVKAIQWKFASSILYAADQVAHTKDCYPVLITSFKCSPDSFVIEYFKEILNERQKPYLILQLDEHDSAVGYETRIESAIRAFRNHRNRESLGLIKNISGPQSRTVMITKGEKLVETSEWKKYLQKLVDETSHILNSHTIKFNLFSKVIQQAEGGVNSNYLPIFSGASHLKDMTLLIPSWDTYVGPLLAAVLQHSGIDARLIPNSDESIRRSLSLNTGQCLPLNIIVQNAIDYIESTGLEPCKTALWVAQSDLSCNLSMFPMFMKKLLDNYGNGMDRVSIYVGDLIFYDISLSTAINAYLAYMVGGYLRKIGCSIRPYEKVAGITDLTIDNSLQMLTKAFRYNLALDLVLAKIMADIETIETTKRDKPQVAIFGDVYVRDNDLMNQDLVKTIEFNGGEVITTPYSEFLKIIVDTVTERFLITRHYSEYVKLKFLKSLIPLVEEKYKKYFFTYNGESHPITSGETTQWLHSFGLNILHRGESLDNILKIHTLITNHPNLDLFIQTNPSYCCPSLVTEAMTSKIEEITGVPVVTIEYDGTSGIKNNDIIPYLKYRKKKGIIRSKKEE